jgi:hypothetical protein
MQNVRLMRTVRVAAPHRAGIAHGRRSTRTRVLEQPRGQTSAAEELIASMAASIEDSQPSVERDAVMGASSMDELQRRVDALNAQARLLAHAAPRDVVMNSSSASNAPSARPPRCW